MNIYIASSWKNEHGVTMLTELLRQKGHEVHSWIENNYGEKHNHVTKEFSFDEWMKTEESENSFIFDTTGATNCDLFIFYAYGGNDAHAEMGAAWAKGIQIIGLHQKGQEYGLMSKMCNYWFGTIKSLLEGVDQCQLILDHNAS